MTMRTILEWLRRRRAAKLERDVAVAADTRRHGYRSTDGSQGEVHPQHNAGQHP